MNNKDKAKAFVSRMDRHCMPEHTCAFGPNYNRVTMDLKTCSFSAYRTKIEMAIRTLFTSFWPNAQIVCVGFLGRTMDEKVVLFFVEGDLTRVQVSAVRSTIQSMDARATVFYPIRAIV